MSATTNTRKEYRMAYRAMRNWWKLVDMNNHPGISYAEKQAYQAICDSYQYKELSAAMESISARRNAEYVAEHLELRHFKPKSEAPYSADNLPF